MKIGILITARLKSTRLPKKLLLNLNGKSIVERVIDRCNQINGIDHVILCTSTNPQDKPLIDVSIKNGIHYFLGSEEDVLQRLSDAATSFGLDFVLSITGENPLFSILHSELMLKKIRETKADFLYLDGLPIGCGIYGLSTCTLKIVCEIKKEMDTEIWGPLVNRPEIFQVEKIPVDAFYYRPKLRITTDYPEDYQFIETIYSHFKKDHLVTLKEGLDIIDQNPEYLSIHRHREQATPSKEVLYRIDNFYLHNRSHIQELKKKFARKELNRK